MEPTQLTASLIELFDRAQSDQRELLAALTDHERAAVGTADHWSVKDTVLHIAFWKNCQAERLAAAAAWGNARGVGSL